VWRFQGQLLMNTQSDGEEIFRQEGENFRSIMVSITEAGGLQLDAQDMGKLVEEVWGDSDYEFWVTIPPEGLAKLARALVKKLYAGRERAVDELRELCVAEGVPHAGGSWA
jgi:hypothetical protein